MHSRRVTVKTVSFSHPHHIIFLTQKNRNLPIGSVSGSVWMGSGSSVVVHQPHVSDAHFKDLLASKEARKVLFKEITAFQTDERLASNTRISLKKLVGYFGNESHALYPGFDVNVDILSEAFKYTTKHSKDKLKKKKHQQAQEQISLRDFHAFLPTLLLFDRLWDLFDAADKVVIEDKRVFKGEFVGIYDRLYTLSEVTILGNFTKDEWAAEFSALDINGDGYINFNEFCTYCVAHIERPFDFHAAEVSADSDDEKVDHEVSITINQDSTDSTIVIISAGGTVAADSPAGTQIDVGQELIPADPPICRI